MSRSSHHNGTRDERAEPDPPAGRTRRGVLIPLLAGGVLAGLGVGVRSAAARIDPGTAPHNTPADASGKDLVNDLLVHDVRLFDGERVSRHATVLVLGGRIVAVGTGRTGGPGTGRTGGPGTGTGAGVGVVDGVEVPPAIPTYDGNGRTLFPGLVDCHVHSDPEFRAEAPRFGVTTELDMFGDPAVLPDSRAQRRSLRRTRDADLWSAGVGVTVPGGHPRIEGWDYPTVHEATDVDAFVGARIKEGSDYVKIIVDDGNGSLPTLTPDQVRAAVRAAHRRGKLAVAHAERLAHVRTSVRAGVDGLVHVAIDGPMDDRLIASVRAAGIFVVPTVTVVDCGVGAEDLLSDPRVQPYLSELQQFTLSGRPPRPCQAEYRRHAVANTRRLHRAGVPILAGTDAPLPGTANGVSLFSALDYLCEASLSPAEALTAASSAPARIFGLGDRGLARPGYRADLVLVQGDPTADIRQLRDIAAIWKNGYPVDREPTAPTDS